MAELSTSEWIQVCSVIVVAIGILVGIILHFWPKKQNGEQMAGEIRSEVIASDINKFLLAFRIEQNF